MTTILTTPITESRSAEAAAEALDANAEEINRMSMSDRLVFLQTLHNRHAVAFGAGDKWLNHHGVITFFRDYGWGSPYSWVSYVNAGVLEAVERGIAIALNPEADDFANPGARPWAEYLTQLGSGELSVPSVHAKAWSDRKKVATDHGVALATEHGLLPTAVEMRFLRLAEGYNWAMCNRAPVDLLVAFAGYVDASLADIDSAAIDRLFAVNSVDTARRACEMAYTIALIEPTPQAAEQLRPLLPLITPMFRAFLNNPD